MSKRCSPLLPKRFRMNILKALRQTIHQAQRSEFYQSKLGRYPLPESFEEFAQFPLTTKEDFRSIGSPEELLAVDESAIVQVNTTSGTTGTPTFSFYTASDLERGSAEVAKAWRAFGVTERSRVQFIMSYGLFSGATHNTLALQALGALVVPIGIQSLTRQLQYIELFKPDTLVGTPSFFMHLHSTLMEHGKLEILRNWSVKRVIAAGEIYSDEYRETLERNLGVQVFNHYGMCEIYSGFAYECNCRSGLHVLDGLVYTEIIDPHTGALLPDGEAGELVVTSIHKEATPIVRYRTGDITRRFASGAVCECHERQSTTHVIDRIHRRVDDLVFVKGLKFDPHQLRDFLLREFGAHIHPDIQIETSDQPDFERPKLLVTLRAGASEEFLRTIRTSLQQETLIDFMVTHVQPEHFERNSQNKIRIVITRPS